MARERQCRSTLPLSVSMNGVGRGFSSPASLNRCELVEGHATGGRFGIMTEPEHMLYVYANVVVRWVYEGHKIHSPLLWTMR